VDGLMALLLGDQVRADLALSFFLQFYYMGWYSVKCAGGVVLCGDSCRYWLVCVCLTGCSYEMGWFPTKCAGRGGGG
jgi:hypothetical protein